MKILIRSLTLALALLIAPAVFAQSGPTGTQQSATRLDACTAYQTASGAPQQTVTISPPSNNSVYICSIEVISVATTAVAAVAALTHTTTNLGTPTSLKLFDFFPASTGVA